MSSQNLKPENARQGEVSGRIRYVLLGGLGGAAITLAVVGLAF